MIDHTPTFRETLIDLAVVLGITVGIVIVLGLLFGLDTITDLFFFAFAIHMSISAYQMFTGWRITPVNKKEKEPASATEKYLNARDLLDFREADLRVALYGMTAILSLLLSLITGKLGR